MHESAQTERELTFNPLVENPFWKPWSVETINEIIWNPFAPVGKGKEKDTKKAKPAAKASTVESKVFEVQAQPKERSSDEDEKYFRDNEIFILPRRYLEQVLTWKRPHQLFPDTSAENLYEKIFVSTELPYDLYELNRHLELSSYFNHILDCFEALRLYEDFERDDFDGFGFTSWKPTNHIYAMGKVEKNKPHHTMFNPYGRYIVRLYHCGKWRQIQVDDRIPVDFHGRIVMPCIYKDGLLELWPLLITKAILKLNFARMFDDGHYYLEQIASHQCRMYDGMTCRCKDVIPIRKSYLFNEPEVYRLNVIYLLTGWFPDELEFSGKRSAKVWDIFLNTFPSFEHPVQSFIDKRDEKSTRGKKRISIKLSSEIIEERQPRELLPLTTLDIKLGPSESCKKTLYMEVNCLMVRSIPLEESSQIPNALPLWKTYRWLFWATEKGMWKPEDETVNWSMLCRVPKSRHGLFEPLFEKEWAKKFYHIESHELKRMQSQVSNKKLSKAKKIDAKLDKNESSTEHLTENSKTNVWIDFNKLMCSLECLKIYYKNHKFRTNIFISNEDEPSKSVSGPIKESTKQAPKKGKKPEKLSAVVAPDPHHESALSPTTIHVYGDDRSTLFIFLDQEITSDAFIDLVLVKEDRHVPEAKAKIDKYYWNCVQQQRLTELSTQCMGGKILCLPTGRIVYRLRFTAKSFCFHIKTNSTRIQIVDEDELFERMAIYSIRFERYLHGVFRSLKDYVDSIGDPSFVENMTALYSSMGEFCKEPYGSMPEIRTFMWHRLPIELFRSRNASGDTESLQTLRRFCIMPDPKWTFNYAPLTLGKTFLATAKAYNMLARMKCDCPGEAPIFTPEQEEEIRQCAALKIQAAMKMYYIKLLLRYHSPQEPNRKYYEMLKSDATKFYQKFFVEEIDQAKEFFVGFLWNSTFEHLPMDHLMIPFSPTMRFADVYEFCDDFHYMVKKIAKPYDISSNIKARSWYPLKTGCLFSHAPKYCRYMIRAKSSALDSKATFYIQILNNDDMKIIPMCDIPDMWSLCQNTFGYKMFVYLYSLVDVEKTESGLPWTLEVIFPRNAPAAHFCNHCNDTMCPCDQPPAPASPPFTCTQNEIVDFQLFSDFDESSSKEGLIGKYVIRTQEIGYISIFFSCTSDLFEFELKVVQAQARHVIAHATDLGRISIVALQLKQVTENWPFHKTSNFFVTITCLRRVRPASRILHRSSEVTLRSAKLASDSTHSNIMRGMGISVPDRFAWNITFAYDKGIHFEIERIDLKNSLTPLT